MRDTCLPAFFLVLVAIQRVCAVRLGEEETVNEARSSVLYNGPFMAALQQKLRTIAFRTDGTLNMPRGQVKGECSRWEDFTSEGMGQKEWQCANTNWIYAPTPDVTSNLRRFFENPSPVDEDFVKPAIDADKSNLWCSNVVNEDVESFNARQYWNACGLTGGGYINAMRCKD